MARFQDDIRDSAKRSVVGWLTLQCGDRHAQLAAAILCNSQFAARVPDALPTCRCRREGHGTVQGWTARGHCWYVARGSHDCHRPPGTSCSPSRSRQGMQAARSPDRAAVTADGARVSTSRLKVPAIACVPQSRPLLHVTAAACDSSSAMHTWPWGVRPDLRWFVSIAWLVLVRRISGTRSICLEVCHPF